MIDGNFSIECRKRGGHCRRRVALNDDAVRLACVDDLADAADDPGSNIGQALVRLHQIEVVIRPDGYHLQDLVEHLPVLRGNTDLNVETGVLAQRVDDRKELDRFWPRSENDKDFHRQPSALILLVCGAPETARAVTALATSAAKRMLVLAYRHHMRRGS